jgi:large subunit ribosomal protein L15
VPKRGFTNIFRIEFAVVNVDRIAEVFEAGTVITPELLQEKGLVARNAEKVKVLARGDVAKALTIKAHKFSGKAAEKIAAAGGSTEVL